MKKNFLKIAFTSLMLVFGMGVANAQFGGQMPSPEEMAKMQADQMKETVKLNDDQYAKVLVVYKEQGEQMQKMFQEGGQPDMGAFQKMHEEQDKKLKEILTDEQYKKWNEHQQQMMQQFQGGGF